MEHLMHSLVASGAKVVMVSSTLANVGKSYILKRLTEQALLADKRVLALDLDRREPSLHLAFGVPPKVSLASVALNQAGLRDAIVHVNDHLDYAGSTGRETTYGSSRWQFDRIRKDLETLKADYDLVLIDSAAMRRDPMVTQLWALADHILVVVDAMETSVPEVEEFLQRSAVSKDKVSFVLNKVRYKPDFLFEA
jgi:Mrp family chromosome partitioning ATPase